MSTEPKYPRKMTRRIPDVPGGLETAWAPPGFFLVPAEHALPDDIEVKSSHGWTQQHQWVVTRRLPEGQLNDDDDGTAFMAMLAAVRRDSLRRMPRCGHAASPEVGKEPGDLSGTRRLNDDRLNDDSTIADTLAPDSYTPASDYWESAIAAELARAKRKFPRWPTDPVHAAAIVSEEAGELVRAVNEACYEPHKGGIDAAITEAIQLGAMVRRFLESAGRYQIAPGPQHDQDLTT